MIMTAVFENWNKSIVFSEFKGENYYFLGIASVHVWCFCYWIVIANVIDIIHFIVVFNSCYCYYYIAELYLLLL